jgi:hypothetical protein
VQHDAGGLDLHPRPVARLVGGVGGETGQAFVAPALVLAELDGLISPLEAVGAEDLDVVREPEPGEVLDAAAGDHRDRRQPGQIGDGVEDTVEQPGVVGVGDDRRQDPVHVEPDEEWPRQRRGHRRHGRRLVHRLHPLLHHLLSSPRP